MRNDQEIEAEMQAKSLTAPRITAESIERRIVNEFYFTAQDGVNGSYGMPRAASPSLNLLTICVLEMRNGFTVVGTSACVSPANFDADLGKQIARLKAIDQLWALEGYLLRERLAGTANESDSARTGE